jgi:hypothetical protein
MSEYLMSVFSDRDERSKLPASNQPSSEISCCIFLRIGEEGNILAESLCDQCNDYAVASAEI